MKPLMIGPNMHVTLDYTLKSAAGEVLDDSRGSDGEPIQYVHGYGQLVPGLEAGLVGLKEGDIKEIRVKAADGFGDRDEELVLEIDRAEVPNPDKVKVGDELVAESPDGEEIVMQVIELTQDGVVVDANHPLAGMDLHYSVKVRAIREAEDAEIEEAATQFEEAREHVHGPDCDHDHDDHTLVELKRKN